MVTKYEENPSSHHRGMSEDGLTDWAHSYNPWFRYSVAENNKVDNLIRSSPTLLLHVHKYIEVNLPHCSTKRWALRLLPHSKFLISTMLHAPTLYVNIYLKSHYLQTAIHLCGMYQFTAKCKKCTYKYHGNMWEPFIRLANIRQSRLI